MTQVRRYVFRRFLVSLALCLSAVSCASSQLVPKHLITTSPAELRSRMDAAQSPVRTIRGEARLTYFGPSGRLKGTATIVAERPGRFRYNLLGPHGGVLEAFATDGTELQVLKLLESRYLYGPATAATLDKLLAFAPLKLDSEGWVGLLFGAIPVPDGALIQANDASGRLEARWSIGGREILLDIEPRSAVVERMRVYDGAELVSEVVISERDELGLPKALQMKVPGSKIELDLRLRDIEADIELPKGTFYIAPPDGFRAEYVGSGAT